MPSLTTVSATVLSVINAVSLFVHCLIDKRRWKELGWEKWWHHKRRK